MGAQPITPLHLSLALESAGGPQGDVHGQPQATPCATWLRQVEAQPAQQPSPRRSPARVKSGQKSKLPPGMWGLTIDAAGGLLPRPLTWSREECTEATATRQPALEVRRGCTSGHRPGTAPCPAPTPLLPDQSQARRPPPATWESLLHSPGLYKSAAASRRSSSPPAQLAGAGAGGGRGGAGGRDTLARLRTSEKAELDPAPSCCCAPPLCVQETSGAAPQQLPLVTGEAAGGGGGGGGTRREDGECGGLGPRSWPVSPLPSPGPGRGTELKAKEGMGRRSACCLGPRLVLGGGGEPRGRPGPGEEGGACKGSEAEGRGWKCAWLSAYGARAPSLLWGLG